MKPTSNIDILLQCLYVALPKKGKEGPQTENVLSHYLKMTVTKSSRNSGQIFLIMKNLYHFSFSL